MSEKEPKGPYVYQPYGVATSSKERVEAGRLFGIGGVPYAEIKGLTKNEANSVRAVLDHHPDAALKDDAHGQLWWCCGADYGKHEPSCKNYEE